MTTMLQLIQQATGEMGLAVPTYVAGNPSQDQVQQLALLNAVGNELQREYIWQHSTIQYRFSAQYLATAGDTVSGSAVVTNLASTTGLDSTYQVTGAGINVNVSIVTVDSPTQVTLSQPCTATGTGVALNFGKVKYALPSDYDRPMDRSQWDVTKHWELLGPVTAQQWEFLQSGWIATGPRIQFRLLGGYFQIWPVQTSADLLGMEYVSKNWVMSTGVFAPDKSMFTVDTDTCAFPDRLMVLGLKKKFFEVKGFDSTTFGREFQSQLDIAFANDQGSATLSMAPRLTSNLIGWNNIPDSFYGNPQ